MSQDKKYSYGPPFVYDASMPTSVFPDGENECAATRYDSVNKKLIWWNINSNGNHGVYELDILNKNIRRIDNWASEKIKLIMPNYPEPNSQSESSKHPDSYYTEKVYTQQQYDELKNKMLRSAGGVGASLPIVNSISGYALEGLGWNKKGSTFTKDENTIVYNGHQWTLNGKEIIQFIQEIPK